MGKIDTSGWKEFRVGDLFDIHPTKAYKCTNAELLDGGGTNVVVNSAYDNGIGGTSTFSPTENGNMITFSDTVDANTIFYQKSPFVGYPHVQGLYPVGKYQNAWTQGSLQYFVTVFRERALAVGFDYGNKFRRDIAANLFVKLPSTPDGAPDWAYMESYMANLETKVAESLTMLQAAKDAKKKKVDTREWGEFRVGELFEKLNLRFLPNRVFDKASDISEVKSEEFNLPLVNAKHSNNGIMYYGRKHEWEYEVLTIDIVADGAASTGDVYAQLQETGVLYNAYLVKPKAKCVTGLILFFLATVIQRCVKDHFGYDNKCTWDKVKHETILLPVDKTGQPDWAYMEEYMRKVEERVKKTINTFCVIRNIKFDC